jgi:hypothetical protein
MQLKSNMLLLIFGVIINLFGAWIIFVGAYN